MKKKSLPILVIAVVVVVGLAFWGGMQYGSGSTQPNTSQSRTSSTQAGNFAGRRNSQGQQAGFVSGSVLNQDTQSITVQARDGSSKIVLFSSSTKVTKSVDGTVGDLQSGEQVTAMGVANSDGSVTAQSIQIRPAGLPGQGAPDNRSQSGQPQSGQ
jgi:hypothetical protein